VIDLHCHVDLYPDPKQVVLECEQRGMRVLSVTTTPSAWHGTSSLAAHTKGVRTALGLHPQLAHERKHEMGLFEELLPATTWVGEIGLDGAPEFRAHWADQSAVFDRVLQLCSSAGGRRLSIHSRRAATAVLDGLARWPKAGTPILHWFSGTMRELERAVSAGCWFSVGPAMLRGERGRALAARMPLDKVLTESDGPFARIGDEPAKPWDVELAVCELANIWNTPVEAVHQRLRENLRRLVTPLGSREPAADRRGAIDDYGE
jgi:TatD DNase family protein